MKLSRRQGEILDYIQARVASDGLPPTRAEINRHAFGHLADKTGFGTGRERQNGTQQTDISNPGQNTCRA